MLMNNNSTNDNYVNGAIRKWNEWYKAYGSINLNTLQSNVTNNTAEITNLETANNNLASTITTKDFNAANLNIDRLLINNKLIRNFIEPDTAFIPLAVLGDSDASPYRPSLNITGTAVTTNDTAPIPVGTEVGINGIIQATEPLANLTNADTFGQLYFTIYNHNATLHSMHYITWGKSMLSAFYDIAPQDANSDVVEIAQFAVANVFSNGKNYSVLCLKWNGNGSLQQFSIYGSAINCEPITVELAPITTEQINSFVTILPPYGFTSSTYNAEQIGVVDLLVSRIDHRSDYNRQPAPLTLTTLCEVPDSGQLWLTSPSVKLRIYADIHGEALIEFSQTTLELIQLQINRHNDGKTYIDVITAGNETFNCFLDGLNWVENPQAPQIVATLLSTQFIIESKTVVTNLQLDSITTDSISLNQITGIEIPDPLGGPATPSSITMDNASFQNLTVNDIGAENIHQSYNQPTTIPSAGWYSIVDLSIMPQGLIFTEATDNAGTIEKDTVQINGERVIDFSDGGIIDQAAINANFFYIHFATSAQYPVSLLTAVNGVYAPGTDPTVVAPIATLPTDAKISSFVDKIHTNSYLFSDIGIASQEIRAADSIKTRNIFKTNYAAFNSTDQYPAIDAALQIPNQVNLSIPNNWYKVFSKLDLPSGKLTMVSVDNNYRYTFTWSASNDILTLSTPDTNGVAAIVQVGTDCYIKTANPNVYTITAEAEVANTAVPANTPVIPFTSVGTTDPGPNAYTIGVTNGSLYFGPNNLNAFTFIGTITANDQIINNNLTVNGTIQNSFADLEHINMKDTILDPTKYWIVSYSIGTAGQNYIMGDILTDPNGNTFEVTGVLAGTIVSVNLTSNPLVAIDPQGTLSLSGGAGTAATITITSQPNAGTGRYPSSQAVIDYIQNNIIISLPDAASFNALVTAGNLLPNTTYLYPDASNTQIIDDTISQNNTTWSSIHISAELAIIVSQIQALAGSGIYIGHNNFGHVPTPLELTNYVLSERPTWTTPEDGSIVINDFDGHEWRFSSNVWVDLGFTNVSQWSNTTTGIIKGVAASTTNAYQTFGTLSAQADGTARVNNLFLVDRITYDALPTPKPDGIFVVISEVTE